MRAFARISASTAALAANPPEAQPFAILRNMPSQWRREGGRWPVAGNYFTAFVTENSSPVTQIIVTRERIS